MSEPCLLQRRKLTSFKSGSHQCTLCLVGRRARAAPLLSGPAGSSRPSTQWGHHLHLPIICLIHRSITVASLSRTSLWLCITLELGSKFFLGFSPALDVEVAGLLTPTPTHMGQPQAPSLDLSQLDLGWTELRDREPKAVGD